MAGVGSGNLFDLVPRFITEYQSSVRRSNQRRWAGVERRTEDNPFTGIGNYDPDFNLSPTQGGSAYFRRLSQSSRELNPIIQERSLEIAMWLYDSNPMAKRVVELTRDFLVGEGVTVSSQDADEEQRKRQQEVLDRFWNDPYNNFPMKLYDKVLELGLFGEQLYTVQVTPTDGHVRLGYIDNMLILDVIRNPRNIEINLEVVLKTIPGYIGDPGPNNPHLHVLGLEENPDDRWYGRVKAAKTDARGVVTDTYTDRDSDGNVKGVFPYLSSCVFFAINKPTNAKRGRSDLLTIIDWIDTYDQILFGEADRHLLLRNFIWDVTCKGMNQQQINKYIAEQGNPKPGSVRGHNEKIEWAAVTPDMKSGDVSQGADLLLSYMANGAGHPKTWLNGMMDVNRSAASEMGTPGFKRLAARQRYVKYMLEYLCSFQLDQAEIAGRLPRRKNLEGSMMPDPWKFSVNMPEIQSRDLDLAARTFLNTINGMSRALEDGAMDVDTYQEVIVTLLDLYGIEVDLFQMRDRIKANPPAQMLAKIGAFPPNGANGKKNVPGVGPGVPGFGDAGDNKPLVMSKPPADVGGQGSGGNGYVKTTKSN